MRAERVSTCYRAVVPGRGGVDVLHDPGHSAAHYAGLQTCGSVWLCPVCAAKISERRRVELAEACAAWRELGEGRQLALVTLTLQHHAGENLADVLKTLQKARRHLVSGREASDFNLVWGIEGQVRSLEITHGDNGWHPHMHVLLFINGETNPTQLQEVFKQRWQSAVESEGGYASLQYGCDVRFTDEQISDYIAKYGKEPKWTAAHEVTKAISKTGIREGRTPMKLLFDYNNGDKRAGRLWIQYACNFKGQRQLFWSHGLRKKLGLAKEKTDEEVAAEQEETAVILTSLTVGAWRVVLRKEARGELLRIAATGDREAVAAFLQGLGLEGAALAGDDQADAGDELPVGDDQADTGDELLVGDELPVGRLLVLQEAFGRLYERARAQQILYDAGEHT